MRTRRPEDRGLRPRTEDRGPIPMPVTRRDFIRGGVAAFTVSFTAPAFLSDIARAQGARSRSLVVRVSRGRQRCAEHRRAVSGSVLLQPPADDRRSGRAGAADRKRLERSRARPASAAHRAAQHLQRGPARHHPADRLSEFEPVALPGIRHLGHGESVAADIDRVAGALPRTVPQRSARRDGARRAKCRGRCSRAR